MTNETIRTKLFVNGIKQWELAKELNIPESSFTRKLRNELVGEELETVMRAIDSIIEKRKSAEA